MQDSPIMMREDVTVSLGKDMIDEMLGIAELRGVTLSTLVRDVLGAFCRVYRSGTDWTCLDPAHISDYLIDIGAACECDTQQAEELFAQVKLDSITLYPDVLRILSLLQSVNIRIAIVTDAHSTNAHERMTRLCIEKFFPVLITPDISGKRKPDHTPFLLAMKKLNAHPETTWVVGDSLRREIEPCLSLGLTTIYARYGDWIMPDLPHVRPHYTLNTFSDLITLPGLSHLIPTKEHHNNTKK